MKAILEFNLPEDQEQFEDAINGHKLSSICYDLDRYLRGKTKHAPDSMSDEEYKALTQTRDYLYGLLNERDLSFK